MGYCLVVSMFVKLVLSEPRFVYWTLADETAKMQTIKTDQMILLFLWIVFLSPVIPVVSLIIFIMSIMIIKFL